MSYLMAAFLWCLLALYTALAGVVLVLAGAWEIGSGFLLFAALAGRISYNLGKDPS